MSSCPHCYTCYDLLSNIVSHFHSNAIASILLFLNFGNSGTSSVTLIKTIWRESGTSFLAKWPWTSPADWDVHCRQFDLKVWLKCWTNGLCMLHTEHYRSLYHQHYHILPPTKARSNPARMLVTDWDIISCSCCHRQTTSLLTFRSRGLENHPVTATIFRWILCEIWESLLILPLNFITTLRCSL